MFGTLQSTYQHLAEQHLIAWIDSTRIARFRLGILPEISPLKHAGELPLAERYAVLRQVVFGKYRRFLNHIQRRLGRTRLLSIPDVVLGVEHKGWGSGEPDGNDFDRNVRLAGLRYSRVLPDHRKIVDNRVGGVRTQPHRNR